jgi:hypothetical protein
MDQEQKYSDVLNLWDEENSPHAERLRPLDRSMQRTSVFIPDYLNSLLSMVAAKEGVGKAKLIRNAILHELSNYIQELKHRASGKYDSIQKGNAPDGVMSDSEADLDWVKELYRNFSKQDEKFPDPVQLHIKKR